MPTTEYRAVLVCTEAHGSCTVGEQHVLHFTTTTQSGRAYQNGTFDTAEAATDFARGMMSKVWGSWHSVLIEQRVVTPWAEPMAADPKTTDPALAMQRTVVIEGSCPSGDAAADQVQVLLHHDGTVALRVLYPDDDSYMTVYPAPDEAQAIGEALMVAGMR